jgi:deoxycytidine triphosphate deaminase
MLIVGDNLKQLCKQNDLCKDHAVEEFSVKVNLGKYYYSPNSSNQTEVIYGRSSTTLIEKLFDTKEEITDKLTIEPGKQVLTASDSIFKMPLGYFGIIQTKGTLARLFVTATCNDGQIEPGFEGYITLEIVNLSPWKISIPLRENIAQLFIFKCSSTITKKYQGRYLNNAMLGPTLPIFE